MRSLACYAAAMAFFIAFSGGIALASVCQTDHLLCATTMPVDGYCQCTARGGAEDGTVVAKAPHGMKINSTAGGCGTNPKALGCH
jgi:hypothetical protein